MAFEHIDYINMPLERLDARGKELSANMRNIEYTGERKAQVQAELGMIALELWCRHQEGKIEFANQAGETVPLDVE